MQKAKESVQAFIAKTGHHNTTVSETVAPAVQHEVVKPHRHEEVTVATDKEVHQDHYHHTVQPIKDREVLPEQHHHNLMPVEHREVDHRDHKSIERNVADIQGQFKDERKVHDTTHSQSAAAAVGGEHVHHHIHETIQPVLHKETIQPSVVHTTVPIHEVHHNPATHHGTSELPALSLSEFKNKGGSLHGREERHDAFEGEPKNISGILGHGTQKHNEHDQYYHHDDHSGHAGAVGAVGSHGVAERTGLKGSTHETRPMGKQGVSDGLAGGAVQGERRAEEHHVRGDNAHDMKHDASLGQGARVDEPHSSAAKTQAAPSMLQRLNPFADADGDGKKGIMD